MRFDPGLAVHLAGDDLSFRYGTGVFGPEPEYRRLDAIRQSLLDPGCDGPDPVYSIAMDVGQREHLHELENRHLLFGVVAYAAGSLGREPVRSQGHVHAVALHCGWSTPEIFEVWQGCAIIYGQQSAGDDPGRCVAIEAHPGEQVVMPPGWAHCVINASPSESMVFGALCVRQYGFVYDQVRAHGGLAWFPLLDAARGIAWTPNAAYVRSPLIERRPRPYSELGLTGSVPLYEQFARDPESLQWVSDPQRCTKLWPSFEP